MLLSSLRCSYQVSHRNYNGLILRRWTHLQVFENIVSARAKWDTIYYKRGRIRRHRHVLRVLTQLVVADREWRLWELELVMDITQRRHEHNLKMRIHQVSTTLHVIFFNSFSTCCSNNVCGSLDMSIETTSTNGPIYSVSNSRQQILHANQNDNIRFYFSHFVHEVTEEAIVSGQLEWTSRHDDLESVRRGSTCIRT